LQLKVCMLVKVYLRGSNRRACDIVQWINASNEIRGWHIDDPDGLNRANNRRSDAIDAYGPNDEYYVMQDCMGFDAWPMHTTRSVLARRGIPNVTNDFIIQAFGVPAFGAKSPCETGPYSVTYGLLPSVLDLSKFGYGMDPEAIVPFQVKTWDCPGEAGKNGGIPSIPPLAPF
jgi:hypothetical protein